MRNILLIATLSLCAFAWAQAADQDSYSQTVAAQAQQNNLAKAAIAQSAAVAAASEAWNNEQPGSIASNSGEDFYDSTVAAQAQLNSLIKASFTQSGQEAMPAAQETSSLADPESMASNEELQRTDEDSYSQKVDKQADLNSRILGAGRLEASVQLEGSSGSDQPGSMASNEGAQSPSDDFYGQTITIQANANRLLQDSNQQQ
jgi:hypothetical protein